MDNDAYSWDFIKQFHNKSPLINIKRKKEIEEKYLIHKNKLKDKNINIEDYLDNLLFKNDFKYIITENDFPYNLKNGIEHKLLWINPNYNNLFNDKLINKIISMLMIGKTYIYFENIDNNKSIKSIKHYHIFINNS